MNFNEDQNLIQSEHVKQKILCIFANLISCFLFNDCMNVSLLMHVCTI